MGKFERTHTRTCTHTHICIHKHTCTHARTWAGFSITHSHENSLNLPACFIITLHALQLKHKVVLVPARAARQNTASRNEADSVLSPQQQPPTPPPPPPHEHTNMQGAEQQQTTHPARCTRTMHWPAPPTASATPFCDTNAFLARQPKRTTTRREGNQGVKPSNLVHTHAHSPCHSFSASRRNNNNKKGKKRKGDKRIY